MKNWERKAYLILEISNDKKMAKEYLMSFSMEHKVKQFEFCTHILKDNT